VPAPGDRRAEHLLEGLPSARRVGAPVVAVQRRPVDVGVARVEAGERGGAGEDGVGRPHPRHVRGADRAEQRDDAPEGRDVLTCGVAVDALGPRVPGAVHLVREAQQERLAPGLDLGGPAADQRVPRACGDGGEPVRGLGRAPGVVPGLPGEHRRRSAGDGEIAVVRREVRRVGPVAIVHDHGGFPATRRALVGVEFGDGPEGSVDGDAGPHRACRWRHGGLADALAEQCPGGDEPDQYRHST
jgi:hypothetical protein